MGMNILLIAILNMERMRILCMGILFLDTFIMLLGTFTNPYTLQEKNPVILQNISGSKIFQNIFVGFISA